MVIYPNSMTTLRLARFDGGIEFQGPFLKSLAPRSLPKMSAIFSRGPNLKCPPGLTKMSMKKDLEQLSHQSSTSVASLVLYSHHNPYANHNYCI